MLKGYLYKVFMLSLLLFASCNAIMDEDICIDDVVTRKVTFRVAMNNASRNSRAAWSEGYDTGEEVDYDNRIAYNALRVQFYTLENQYIGEVSGMMYWAVNENSYRFAGDISGFELSADTDYKVVVLANCPYATTSIDDLYFDIKNSVYPDGYIPMWGVKSFRFTGSGVQDLGTIDLLRAMAKVEVTLSNQMVANGYSLDNVVLNHHNTQGYCLPSLWSSVNKTSELDQDNCINPRHSHVTEPLALAEVEDGVKYWVYIPEYNVLHTATNRPTLSVTIGNGAEELEFPAAIKFGNYDSQGDFIENSDVNIVRNHIYSFNITAISSGIELEYNVLDWEDGGTWDRGEFAYPTYNNPIVPDCLNPTVKITAAPVMKYNNTSNPETDAFVAWFKMMKPAGQLWTPAIDQLSSDYELRVYNHLGERLTEQSQWVASDNWYKIVVLPLNPENSGVVVKFGITYHQDWMPDGKSIYLFVNGKADEIAWPESGNDPKIIEIKQL